MASQIKPTQKYPSYEYDFAAATGVTGHRRGHALSLWRGVVLAASS
jgi:hypothetical protein